MRVDQYSFGSITISGTTYTADVIIYPGRIDSAWWRREGHYLQKADLTDIVAAKPDLLIIGTGAHGVMSVPESTLRFLEEQGIGVAVRKTADAVALLNSQPEGSNVIAALHLTC